MPSSNSRGKGGRPRKASREIELKRKREGEDKATADAEVGKDRGQAKNWHRTRKAKLEDDPKPSRLGR